MFILILFDSYLPAECRTHSVLMSNVSCRTDTIFFVFSLQCHQSILVGIQLDLKQICSNIPLNFQMFMHEYVSDHICGSTPAMQKTNKATPLALQT